MENELIQRINKLERDLMDLNQEYYRTNFSSQQDFPKYSNFTTRIKVPVHTTKPATCEIGELCSQGGNLYVCSAADTWTVAGTQS